MGEDELDDNDTNKRITQHVEFARYYHELVINTATVPSDVDAELRLGDVKREIYLIAQANTRRYTNGQIWATRPTGTIVGQLGNFYRSGNRQPKADADYQDLGTTLWPLRENIRGWNKGAYSKAIKVFAPQQEGKKDKK